VSNCITAKTKSTRVRIAAVVAYCFEVAGLICQQTSLAEPVKPSACTATQYTQFDFWVGDVDVFELDNPKKAVAHTRVTRILDACV
jgi:hypothetical protein